MSPTTICCPIQTNAMAYAIDHLQSRGYEIQASPTPVTEHLLLPVPSFPKGHHYLVSLMDSLPKGAAVYGGFLNVPPLIGYKRVDFLTDPYYLAQNAAITADCAIEIATNLLQDPVKKHRILILGWGRIGKCLGKQLDQRGADVTIAARKDGDLAMIQALGYHSVALGGPMPQADLIINTIPTMVLPQVPENSYAIELASKPGMAGENIISALGLPGKMRPETSGRLIAETFIRLSNNQEATL